MPAPPSPPLARLALAVLAAGGAAVVYALARFWGANPEYLDRFLIVLGAAYAAWEVRPELAALDPRPTRAGYLPLLAGAAAEEVEDRGQETEDRRQRTADSP